MSRLAKTVFPTVVAPVPPPPTEMVELFDAVDVEAWALEHELTREGHECEDMLLRYRDETKPAVYCPRCRLLVGARDWVPTPASPALPGPTHLETVLLVARANIGAVALVALMVWMAWLGFTTPGVAFLIAVVLLAAYAASRGRSDDGT